MEMFAPVIKETYKDADKETIVVAIMPCTAKKAEAARKEFVRQGIRDVDYVITTQELVQMIREAGIDFSANIILGAAGTEKWRENAAASAQLLNEVKPYLIFLATLHVDAGSPLYEEREAGAFAESTLGQNIQEELELLRRLDLDGTAFFGLHTSNVIPVAGTLPEDKAKLIGMLERGMAKIPARILDSRPEKGYEGMAILE